jgi:V8-like Glu-specific endopeptidase
MQRFTAAVILGMLGAGAAHADEGMWTFDNAPKAAIKQKLGVQLTDTWLQQVQRSITRHESGCTGSFVSPEGLVLTNHHCITQCLAELSSQEQDYLAAGFNAPTRSAERQCPGEILSVLIEVENITTRVDATTRGLSDAKANEARKRTLSTLEAECTARAQSAPGNNTGKQSATGKSLACEAVTLYQGGQYFLYKYQRYEDVRLAFAPHAAIAAFGGDPDNFNFPRWSLDFGLLRVYENGQPARTPNYLQWRNEGPASGEPVFVTGHPGTTSRLLTVAQLDFERDTFLPATLLRSAEMRGRLIQWGKNGAEQLRVSQDLLFGIENSLKVFRGLQRALLDERLMQDKRREEQQLRTRLARDPKLAAQTGDAWTQVEAAERRHREIYQRLLFLERGAGFGGELFGFARLLVRGATERSKPNAERLREFADSNLPKLAAEVLAEIPIYPELEELRLSFSLDKLREALGPDEPIVRSLLGAESPDTLAARLVRGTRLSDAKLRRELWENPSALAASADPMLVLARDMDRDARAVRKIFEDEVQAPSTAAQEKIARARFALLGTGAYPDATFTLRLSYGMVQSWREAGADIPEFTRLERLYQRATGKAPFALPQVWLDARGKLDPKLPFNYVTTNDIVGGNSGSPVVDATGRLVGLAFDGNIHSIAGDYGYDAKLNRMVAVHPTIIITALREVYGASALAQEILGGSTGAAR